MPIIQKPNSGFGKIGIRNRPSKLGPSIRKSPYTRTNVKNLPSFHPLARSPPFLFRKSSWTVDREARFFKRIISMNRSFSSRKTKKKKNRVSNALRVMNVSRITTMCECAATRDFNARARTTNRNPHCSTYDDYDDERGAAMLFEKQGAR